MPEPITLAQAKEYLEEFSADRDDKIEAMIPRARLWVEDHTGLALDQRSFTERHRPRHGMVRLNKGPLVSVEPIEYVDADGVTGTQIATAYPPTTELFADGGWPSLAAYDSFEITYVAGYGVGEVDDRLLGAMYALIEGEYSEGYAYPSRAVEAAERCCGYLRTMVA